MANQWGLIASLVAVTAAEYDVIDIEPNLAALAGAHGVAVEYWDQSGEHRAVSRATVAAVLVALGIDVSTPEAIAAALLDTEVAPWRAVLPPVFVVRQGSGGEIRVHLPHGEDVSVEIVTEHGVTLPRLEQIDRWVEPRLIDDRLTGEATFRVPDGLPLGYHELIAVLQDGSEHRCPVIVTPDRLTVHDLSGKPSWGLMAQLYSIRSRRSWGIGDLVDLADLAAWGAQYGGADWVLVNPLHAASPTVPLEPSPYLPVTRRFANPIYLRVEAVPEYAYLPAAQRDSVEAMAATLAPANTSPALLDRDASWTAKRRALELVHAVPRTPGRQAGFVAYVEREGQGLMDFATWCALMDARGDDAGHWPQELKDPRSSAVDDVREQLADQVEFHLWCQWVLDEQLASAQRAARQAGMSIGIVHDLAVGVHPEGSDAWALGDVLAKGVSVGAPPDMYNQKGQDWSQPPWRPDRLAQSGFAPFRDMLRTVLRNAGGIRIDHVLGLFRLWWIPAGMGADQGTYVRLDHEALVGILALEAQRADCLVIGEDLGTVEEWVQDLLRDRGILGTTILWFESTDAGTPKHPGDWRAASLASVTVHDLPPTAGFLDGEHIRIRDSLNLLARPVEQEWDDLRGAIGDWTQIARGHGYLPESGDPSPVDLTIALHELAAGSPAAMVGVALPDLVGDVRAQNQPGTHREYPNWSVPLCDSGGKAVVLEDLDGFPLAKQIVAAVAAARARALAP